MTDQPTACAAEEYNPYDQSNLPSFYVTVNPETIRGIFDATGSGAEGTRFLYAVQDLRLNEDRDVSRPCESYTLSRWIGRYFNKHL